MTIGMEAVATGVEECPCNEVEDSTTDQDSMDDSSSCSAESDSNDCGPRQDWRQRFNNLAKGLETKFQLSTRSRRNFSTRVSLRLALQLGAGSFCCMVAAFQATEPIWVLLRISLAFVSLCGFSRLFGRFRLLPFCQKTHIPVLCIANYVKIAIFAIAASLAATAATLATTAAMVVTAATVYWRAAWEYGVGRERQWYAKMGGFVLDLMELGALIIQMILMAQWVFGEFSVMPVMASMGMLFTLFHNLHGYLGAHNLADAGELFWWEGAF